MAYVVPAAEQLGKQVKELRPDATVTYGTDVDGIGYVRTVSFDAATTKWLSAILDVINDERISAYGKGGVTFVEDTRADFATPFPLAEVDSVLNEKPKADK